jgi:hypothetical protein
VAGDRLDRAIVERPNVDPFRETLLPQCNDRIGHGLADPDRRHHERRHPQGELEDERGGVVVEQVGVVDQQHERAIGGPLHERRASRDEDVPRPIGQIRQQVAEGTEWDTGGGLRADGACRRVAALRLQSQDLTGDMALADAAVADENDAA